MRRLWVRMSLVMGGLILLFTVLPLFAFLVLPAPTPPEREAPPPRETPLPGEAPLPAPDPRPDGSTDGRPEPPPPRPDGGGPRFVNPWRDLPQNLLQAVLLASVVGIAGWRSGQLVPRGPHS